MIFYYVSITIKLIYKIFVYTFVFIELFYFIIMFMFFLFCNNLLLHIDALSQTCIHINLNLSWELLKYMLFFFSYFTSLPIVCFSTYNCLLSALILTVFPNLYCSVFFLIYILYILEQTSLYDHKERISQIVASSHYVHSSL